MNRYSYCRNNPLIYVDPSGLGWFSKLIGAIIGFIVGAVVSAIAGPQVGIAVGMAVFSAVDAGIAASQAGANAWQAAGIALAAAAASYVGAQIGFGFGQWVGGEGAGAFASYVFSGMFAGAAGGATEAALAGGDVVGGALWGGAIGTGMGILQGGVFAKPAYAAEDEMGTRPHKGGKLKPSQKEIDRVVKKYDLNTSAMKDGRPIYNPNQDPGDLGLTAHYTRRVTIGKGAFKSESLLAATIGHETVHAQQWLNPDAAIAMGRSAREMEATQWMLDNASRLDNTPDEIQFFQNYYNYWKNQK